MPKIELLKHQKKLLNSTARDVLLLGGIGSGKSDCGSMFVIQMLSEYPHTPGIIVAPTYLQLVKATVKAVTKRLNEYNIKHKAILSGADKRIEVPGREPIHLFSLQDPDNFRGPEAGWLLGDEMCFTSEYAVKVASGRIRHNKGPLFRRYVSSPNGFNWAYDKFEHKDGENATVKTELIRAKTKDNVFLPETYYYDLLEEYGGLDNPLARQELNGEFVNLQAGAIYWAFDRNIHVQPCELDPRFPVYVGQDFNIGSMANCYVQYRDGTFYCTHETILDQHGANTDNAATRICTDLKPKYKPLIVPDSTGKALKTSAMGRTDLEILKSYDLEVIQTRNPFIIDRQNNLNVHLKKNKVIISPRCKTVIKEMETLASRDKEGDVAHASVGLGYVLWKLDPLKTLRQSSTRQL